MQAANTSPREQYYAELETLEPDERLRKAINATKSSSSHKSLIDRWVTVQRIQKRVK